ncbi:hypothetical protein G6F57_018740 [Rhizopus arrhizus]|uniref:Uncharacterized protein n=1 Tax=Rhizopus delemar TaxID=936053 RepID=A0A9P6XNM4_9FUNG|nr:hypothetical protein G6F57_018740 [Rhizopus arrhizus]KAG1529419.1 hypothetical protein G6F50_018013 [Rhizopus delemar]
MARTWGSVGAGANYGWAERYAIYGQVDADVDFSGSYIRLYSEALFAMKYVPKHAGCELPTAGVRRGKNRCTPAMLGSLAAPPQRRAMATA